MLDLLDIIEGITSQQNRPWKLLFFEQFETRIEARKREVYLKSGVGKELIKRGWNESHQ